jgi:hypothetical protein
MTEIDPYTATLADGRVVAFYDYDLQPAHPGDFTQAPTPDEVVLDAGAYWADTEENLTPAELAAAGRDPAVIAAAREDTER